jgi:hypothetical protein
MEALALGAFIGNDIISIDTDWRITLVGVDGGSVEEGKRSFNAGAVGDRPFHTAFIDRIIWAFGFAGAAIDAFFCDLNCHVF